MSVGENRAPTGGPTGAHPPGRACPFCGAHAAARLCAACGRDTTAPRRPCANCRRMVPSNERTCWNCGASFKNEMWWKVPLIIFLFLLAFVVSALIALAR